MLKVAWAHGGLSIESGEIDARHARRNQSADRYKPHIPRWRGRPLYDVPRRHGSGAPLTSLTSDPNQDGIR